MQRRIVDELVHLSHTHAGEMIAVVTHAEAIRCVIAAFDGKRLDDMLAVDIDPGRVSAVGIDAACRRVLAVNLRAEQVAL
jgi:broad specificity phosphatase PhoE